MLIVFWTKFHPETRSCSTLLESTGLCRAPPQQPRGKNLSPLFCSYFPRFISGPTQPRSKTVSQQYSLLASELLIILKGERTPGFEKVEA